MSRAFLAKTGLNRNGFSQYNFINKQCANAKRNLDEKFNKFFVCHDRSFVKAGANGSNIYYLFVVGCTSNTIEDSSNFHLIEFANSKPPPASWAR